MNPVNTEEIRWVIWREVLTLLRGIEDRERAPSRTGAGRSSTRYRGLAIPELETWKMVEAHSLSVIIAGAERISAGTKIGNIFGKLGPLKFTELGEVHYLWAQPPVRGISSGLGGRPIQE